MLCPQGSEATNSIAARTDCVAACDSFGRAILGQPAPELLKQVVPVFVSARSRILSQAVTVFGPAILGQPAPELLKQVVPVFVSARSRILSQAVTVFGPIQHTRGKTPACATS